MEEFIVVKKLGTGGQGTTHSVTRKADKQPFVIKQISCANISEANFALKEAKMLQKIVHHGVVKYEDVFLHERREDGRQKLIVCIVMELCQRGDLATLMNEFRRNKRHMEERKAVEWLSQMTSGLEYVHGLKLVHRDLKPLNILVTGQDCVKLGDFGLARQRAADRMSKVGTPCYLAPEVMNEEEYGEAADVWGMGCIALEMLSLNFLWETKGLLSIKVLTTPVTAGEMSPKFSAPVRSFVATMLDKDPRRRPTTIACASFFRRQHNPREQQAQPQQQPPKEPAYVNYKEPVMGGREPQRPSPEPPLRAHEHRPNGAHERPNGTHRPQNAPADRPNGGQERANGNIRPQNAPADRQPEAAKGQEAAPREGYWRHKFADPVGAAQHAARRVGDMAGDIKEQLKSAARGGGAAYIPDASDEQLWEGVSFFVGAGLEGEAVVEVCMQDETFHQRYIGNQDNRYNIMQRVRRLVAERGGGGAAARRDGESDMESAKARLRAQPAPDASGIPPEKLQERRRDVLKNLLGRPLAGVAEDFKNLTTGDKAAPTGADGMRIRREGSGLGGAGAEGMRMRKEGSGLGAAGAEGVRVKREGSGLGAAVAEGPRLHREGSGLGAGEGGGGRANGGGRVPPVTKVETKEDLRKLEEYGVKQYNIAKECVRQAESLQTRVINYPDGSSLRMEEGEMGITLLGVKMRPNVEHYAGQFQNGRYNGYGSIELVESKGRYVGQFVNDRYHGVGHLKLESGDEYFGGFAEGAYHGYGRYTVSSKGKVTTGIFKRGKFEQAIDPGKLR